MKLILPTWLDYTPRNVHRAKLSYLPVVISSYREIFRDRDITYFPSEPIVISHSKEAGFGTF